MDSKFHEENLHLFHSACYGGHLKKIKMYVEQGFPVNSHADPSRFEPGLSGYTPLHFVVNYKNTDALIYLLQKGADITEKSANGWTPVHLAFYYSQHNLVSIIFQHSQINTYVNAVDNIGLTHFHICCALNYRVLQMFITNGARVNCPVSLLSDKYSGFTPLHFAVKYRNSNALFHLLNKGADITRQNADSWSPVHLAYYNCDNDLLYTIFEHSKINTYANVADRTGLTHFHICCALNLPVIKQFIKNVVNINCSVSFLADKYCGYTPLHFAIEKGHSSIIKLLIEYNVDPNIMCEGGLTPLHMAFNHADLSTVELLIAHDADIQIKDSRGRSALYRAVEQKVSADIIQRLITKGALVHEPNGENETPFTLAINSKQYDVVDVMLSQCSSEKETLLTFPSIFDLEDFFHACKDGTLNHIRAFLKHGFSINSQCVSLGNSDDEIFFGSTPLHIAVKSKNKDVIIYLLKNGADISIKNSNGWTPIHLAYYNFTTDLIPLIFEYSKINTYINVADEKGLTHLHICCTLNIPNVIQDYIKMGADINCSTSLLSKFNSGFTPLHFAINNGLTSIVELLLANGANHSLRCKGALTPLHLACIVDNICITALLLDFGADVMAKDSENRLPLHCVFYRNLKRYIERPLADLLLEKFPTDYNHVDSQRLSVLHIACLNRKANIAKRLLDKGCCPNMRVRKNDHPTILNSRLNFDGLTPLHIALYTTDKATTEQLLLAGADINAKDLQGQSPLSYIYNQKFGSHRNSNINMSTDVLIANHLRKLEAAGLYVSNEVKKTFSLAPKINNSVLINHRMCKAELEKMERIKVSGCADGILRSILSKNDTEMSRLVKNENLTTYLNSERLDNLTTEFPLYGFMIKSQVNKGLRKIARDQKAKDSLNRFTGLNVPELCYEQIFKKLNDEDLENLIDALNVRKSNPVGFSAEYFPLGIRL